MRAISGDFSGPNSPLQRRQAVRKDLGITLETIDYAQPAIEIEQRRDPPHSLAQILGGCRTLQKRIEIALRKEMIVGIDDAHALLARGCLTQEASITVVPDD